MNWFFIALIAPAAFAAVNHIDKFLLTKYFNQRSSMVLIVFSSLIGILIAPLIFFFKPEVTELPFSQAWVFAVSGVLFLLALIPYFRALETDDTSLVVPLFQIIPVFSYILGFFLLKETLSADQIFASVLIVLAGIGITLDLSGKKIKFRFRILWLMFIASLLFALDTVLFKAAGVESDFWTGAFWKYIGFLIPGIIILLLAPKYRSEFFAVLKTSKLKVTSLNFLNEIINTIGVLAMNYAILLAPLALVWVVNGFQPFFVFAYGLILTIFFPQIAKEDISKRILIQKTVFLLLMITGTYILHV